jgi:GH18 family chitinase
MPSPSEPGRRRSALTAVAAAVLTAAAGAAVAFTAQPAAHAAVLPNGFRSIGYMPSWAGSANAVPYGKLTHINYAFVLPNGNGSLTPVDNPTKLQSIVSQAHAQGVKVSIAVGGWNDGNDSGFEAMAGNAGTRTTFVNNLVNLVDQYNLDGVDIDWEYPDPGTSATNYTALMQQLSSAMRSRGKLLTAAVVSEGGTANGVQPAVFGLVDWLNIMTYDGGSPHANYDWSVGAVNFWKGRGLPANKAVIGVPVYSRPSYYTFADLVSRDPANAGRDCTTVNGSTECYNGLTTVRRKTQWAMANAGGIMFWELSQDATGSNSLVNEAYVTAMGGGQPPTGRTGRITGLAGKCVDVAAASTANGTAVQLYTCNGTNAQTWTVATDGTVRALGKCLDVTSAGTANGTPVQLWDCNGTGAQVWRYNTADSTLRNPASNRCLDVTGNSSGDGTRLQIWDCFAGANQRWTLP